MQQYYQPVLGTRLEEETKSNNISNNRYVREVDRYMFRYIVPFVQAMEDIRYTALEQKNYVVLKALSDSIDYSVFDNVRKRFHQEDIL
jgi:hypothetical protein